MLWQGRHQESTPGSTLLSLTNIIHFLSSHKVNFYLVRLSWHNLASAFFLCQRTLENHSLHAPDAEDSFSFQMTHLNALGPYAAVSPYTPSIHSHPLTHSYTYFIVDSTRARYEVKQPGECLGHAGYLAPAFTPPNVISCLLHSYNWSIMRHCNLRRQPGVISRP